VPTRLLRPPSGLPGDGPSHRQVLAKFSEEELAAVLAFLKKANDIRV
jgi:hypothetical protein